MLCQSINKSINQPVSQSIKWDNTYENRHSAAVNLQNYRQGNNKNRKSTASHGLIHLKACTHVANIEGSHFGKEHEMKKLAELLVK